MPRCSSDEKGEKQDLPFASGKSWKVDFVPTSEGTRVEVEITFATLEDLEKHLSMGFREGFAAAQGNLDELLKDKAVLLITQTLFIKDVENKQLLVSRIFPGSSEKVWQAWIDHKILDQWWAPQPWKVVTTSQEFREGGTWLYHMEGPKGPVQWCRIDYKTIVPGKSYTGQESFCDEKGENLRISTTQKVTFTPVGEEETKVEMENTFASLEYFQMDFNEGLATAQRQLDELLKGKLNSPKRGTKRKETSSSPKKAQGKDKGNKKEKMEN